jgi:hypothetical protein
MAQDVQIQCVNKTPRADPHLRISHIGGLNADQTRWKLPEADAIEGVKSGRWSFYVVAAGVRANVVIATHGDREYLKTQSDGLQPNNLLSLPECP